MNYGSVCSGIEAASVAWHHLGWRPVWFSEIEPFPCRLLAYRWPSVPNLGDLLRIRNHPTFERAKLDLLVGGTPCQSFSVAGLRYGLADERGNLALEFIRVLDRKRPDWFVWENVPGALSSTGGADFACLLSGWTGLDITARQFTGAGVIAGPFYSVAWRVLDAQYFGVPQRRRRLFVVGHIGADWRAPLAVLFERESLQGDPRTSAAARQKAAGNATPRAGRRGEQTLTFNTSSITRPTNRNAPRLDGPSHTLAAHEQAPAVITGTWWDGGQTSQTLDAVLYKGQTMPEKNRFPAVLQPAPVAFMQNQGGEVITGDIMHALATNSNASGRNAPNLQYGPTVRRITPLEAERLQGFPDHYTSLPGGASSDTARYKALGNSMAVPVMRWLGERITAVDALLLAG